MIKRVITLTVVAIIFGVSGFFLTNRTRRTPVTVGHEQTQAPATRSPSSSAVKVPGGQEGKDATEGPEHSNVHTSTSAPDHDDHDYEVQYDDSPSEEGEEALMSESELLAKAEEQCLDIMHKHEWYRPEDVSITYGPIPYPNPSPGAYIHIKSIGGPPRKRPAHVEARNREIKEEMDRAQERGDGKTMMSLMKESSELNRPYDTSPDIDTHLEAVPPSWAPYFGDIVRREYRRLALAVSE